MLGRFLLVAIVCMWMWHCLRWLLLRYESRLLLHPQRLDHYNHTAMGYTRLHLLRSGAHLVVWDHHLGSRPWILFVGGRTNSVQTHATSLRTWHSAGWNVCALEYRGYGIVLQGQSHAVPTSQTLLADVQDALLYKPTSNDFWSVWITFSMGCVLTSEALHTLAGSGRPVTLPCLWLLWNGFDSATGILHYMAQRGLAPAWLPWLSPTRFRVRPPAAKLDSNACSGMRIVLVHTANDTEIPSQEVMALDRSFVFCASSHTNYTITILVTKPEPHSNPHESLDTRAGQQLSLHILRECVALAQPCRF